MRQMRLLVLVSILFVSVLLMWLFQHMGDHSPPVGVTVPKIPQPRLKPQSQLVVDPLRTSLSEVAGEEILAPVSGEGPTEAVPIRVVQMDETEPSNSPSLPLQQPPPELEPSNLLATGLFNDTGLLNTSNVTHSSPYSDIENIEHSLGRIDTGEMHEVYDPVPEGERPRKNLTYCPRCPPGFDVPWCNLSLPIPERVHALISHLPRFQRQRLMLFVNAANERIKWQGFNWWNEALHGVARESGVTSFPQVISLAASFNRTLWLQVATAISDEARGYALDPAQYSYGSRHVKIDQLHLYLTFWSPNINIFRDPRWGRGQETPGEDPFLTTEYAHQYIMGMQGNDPVWLKTSALCKHFAAYSLENGREWFNAKIENPQDFTDTYFPAFQSCVVRSRASGFMCSYNAVNGVPACQNKWLLTGIRYDFLAPSLYIHHPTKAHEAKLCWAVLVGQTMGKWERFGFFPEIFQFFQPKIWGRGSRTLSKIWKWVSGLSVPHRVAHSFSCADSTDVLRKEWGFRGYTVTDCDALTHSIRKHQYITNVTKAVRKALQAGVDLDCGVVMHWKRIRRAMEQKLVSDKMIRTALERTFTVLFRLGYFNPLYTLPSWARLSFEESVDTPAHRQLAEEAAVQGIVLLKNVDGFLPLNRTRKIPLLAVIGPSANVSVTMQGNYYGGAPYLITPLQGLEPYAEKLVYVRGCNPADFNESDYEAAEAVAKDADAVIVFIGIGQDQERESLDREDIGLPEPQVVLISRVASISKTPIVVVLLSGSSVDISDAEFHPNVHGIIWAGYPGQSGGKAIADILFGHVSPSGRLPITFYYQNYTKQMDMTDMGFRKNRKTGNPGRTYRFFDGPVLYPFGHGLSYAKFKFTLRVISSKTLEYQRLVQDVKATRNKPQKAEPVATLSIGVQNLGPVDAEVAVLIFMRAPREFTIPGRPIKSLVELRKLQVNSNKRRSFRVPLTSRKFTIPSRVEIGEFIVHKGRWTILVEGQQQYIDVL